jgi:lysophospholipase L1-like esterase
LRIAALGTSLTARGNWLESLPDSLAPLLPRPVTTHNFARAGANSRQGLALLDGVAGALPQIVLLEFAINDAALHRGVTLAESVTNMTAMVHRLRRALPDVRLYLMTMSPARGWRGLLRPRLNVYYDQYAEIAAREQVGYIDNRPAWAALSSAALAAALPDGAHPIARVSQAIVTPHVVAVLVRDLAAPVPPPRAHLPGADACG